MAPAAMSARGGYADLMALARDTATFSSSITQDGQGSRHMGVGADPVQPDVEALLKAVRYYRGLGICFKWLGRAPLTLAASVQLAQASCSPCLPTTD